MGGIRSSPVLRLRVIDHRPSDRPEHRPSESAHSEQDPCSPARTRRPEPRRRADDFLGGLWELPSGGVKPGERLVDALCREVLEETGLTVTQATGHAGSFDYVSRSGRGTRQFTFAVTVRATGPITLTEHDDAAWADPGELPAVSDETRALLAG
ncbi:NUDIX hydrolase [Streptomyces sp. NPDC058011]|uniref:NUDIX hydrolase n=1 Tax=Streptomyces sp. NPDC058011 TaxID=3346305 RepID=UPI0036E6420C